MYVYVTYKFMFFKVIIFNLTFSVLQGQIIEIAQ